MSEKMKTFEVSETELLAMKQFYQQEYQSTLRKLEHLNGILSKMGVDVPTSQVLESKPSAGFSSKARTSPAKKTRKKKRGPKPVWGNFILGRIKAADRPVGYPELMRDALVLENIPEEKRASTKASILNSAFRLRAVNNKIDTVGIPGKKEKFLVLTKWMDKGELVSPYKEKFDAIVNLRKVEEEEKERLKPSPRPVGRPRKNTSNAAAPAKKVTAKKPTAKKPSVKKLVVKKPVAKKPVAKKPVAKKPVAKKPVAKKPVVKKPVVKKPVAKKPVAKKPAAKKAAAKTGVAKKPAASKPAAKKPVLKRGAASAKKAGTTNAKSETTATTTASAKNAGTTNVKSATTAKTAATRKSKTAPKKVASKAKKTAAKK
jgi:histone H1/5